MIRRAVLVADRTQARFFTLESTGSGPKLKEHEVLVDPELRLPDRELFSDNKTGRNRAPAGGPAHGYDDHRNHHRDEIERRFAEAVAQETRRLATELAVDRLIVAAEDRMLGFLREALERNSSGISDLRWARKDYSHLAAREIHERLAVEGLLPKPRRA